MPLENEKIIGIVGGMGPQAGAALFNSIMIHTKAATDQDHMSVIMMSLPNRIVDRTRFLERKTNVNPAYGVVEVIKSMVSVGANVIGIACNTCHCPEIFEVIEKQLYKFDDKTILLNMPLETCMSITATKGQIKNVGLMCTNGTYRSKIYEKYLNDFGYNVILPDFDFQNDVIHRMIYDPGFGIKSGVSAIAPEVQELWDRAIDYFLMRNSDAIILGCTELSLIPRANSVDDILIIDSTTALAKSLIREANRYPVSNSVSRM